MSEQNPPIFDTHAHIISPDRDTYPPADSERDTVVDTFTVDDLLAGMDALNVARACVVQRWFYYRDDNSYALDACAANTDRLSPVVMLRGQDPASIDRLREYLDRQPIGGLRFTRPELDIDDTAWMNSPQTMRLWEVAAGLGLPVAFIMYGPHIEYNLPAMRIIAERFPQLPIVVDHLGVRSGASATDVERPHELVVTPALRDMISCPNVHYKFTGINLGWLAAAAVDPAVFLRSFADEFGVDKLVCGSDIGQTRGPYERIVDGLRDAMRLLDDAERKQVAYGNASRIYGAAYL